MSKVGNLHLLILTMLATATCFSVHAAETSMNYGRLGTITLYEPAGTPTELVLFISGDGGWISGVIEMARHFAERGALVAGIDVNQYGKALRESGESCIFTAGDLEQFAHHLERQYKFPTYVNPILVGYSSGATLAYTTLVQSPPGTFKGALSLGFCPDLPWDKPMCPGEGPGLASDRGKPKGFVFRPSPALKDPWIVMQGTIDQVCDAKTTREFTRDATGAELIELPKVGHGYSVEHNYVPQMLAAFDKLASMLPPHPPAPAADISDLPLVEVPAIGPQKDVFAIMLSGDGGWAGLDREVAAVLAKRGVPVIGWDSLRYFWTARTPEVAARDLGRIIHHYAQTWGKSRVIAVGYSLGADTMPFMVNRLPKDARDKLALTALIAPGKEAFFEFHVSLWLGKAGGGLPVAPEMAPLANAGVLCIYGVEDRDSVCAGLAGNAYHKLRLAGGHHFDGNYTELGQQILLAVPGSAQ
jgi:type IV secretory pathway VirJ component